MVYIRAKHVDAFGVVFEWCELVAKAVESLQWATVFQVFKVLLLQQQETHFLHTNQAVVNFFLSDQSATGYNV